MKLHSLVTGTLSSLCLAACDAQSPKNSTTPKKPPQEWLSTSVKTNAPAPPVPEIYRTSAESARGTFCALWMDDTPTPESREKKQIELEAMRNSDGSVRFLATIHYEWFNKQPAEGTALRIVVNGCDARTHTLEAFEFTSEPLDHASATAECQVRVPHAFEGTGFVAFQIVATSAGSAAFGFRSYLFMRRLHFPAPTSPVSPQQVVNTILERGDPKIEKGLMTFGQAVEFLSKPGPQLEEVGAVAIQIQPTSADIPWLLQTCGVPSEITFDSQNNMTHIHYGWLRVLTPDRQRIEYVARQFKNPGEKGSDMSVVLREIGNRP